MRARTLASSEPSSSAARVMVTRSTAGGTSGISASFRGLLRLRQHPRCLGAANLGDIILIFQQNAERLVHRRGASSFWLR